MRKTIVAAVAAGLTLAACSSSTSPRPAASHRAPTPTPAAVAAPAPAITAAQERFIDAMRHKFASAAEGTPDASLAAFQIEVCQYFQVGSTVASAEQQAQSGWPANWASSPAPPPATITKIVTLAAQDGCKASLKAAARLAVKQARQARAARREARLDARQAAAARRLAHSVTYIVTGSYANVTYGPAGSDYQGSVPMDVSAHLGSPEFYAISAQLQGGGSVSCEIEVAGKVISRAQATGGYNIATCEIVQNPLYGGWESANG